MQLARPSILQKGSLKYLAAIIKTSSTLLVFSVLILPAMLISPPPKLTTSTLNPRISFITLFTLLGVSTTASQGVSG